MKWFYLNCSINSPSAVNNELYIIALLSVSIIQFSSIVSHLAMSSCQSFGILSKATLYRTAMRGISLNSFNWLTLNLNISVEAEA